HERSSASALFDLLGETVANMHYGRIIHGDLTTKNILVKDKRIFLIDFGLSFISERIEDKADDLHLLKQALKASSSRSAVLYMSQVFKGYEKIMGSEYRRIIEHQVLKIEKRGRYARVD
ncbi:MAG TPA: lipopolysaccharide kinase InaA family protein, partial [Nitrososphaerales archaeon]|nr:lipopolysaccharide kinase InaA family protein [Nitrososphaerales archaeon]